MPKKYVPVSKCPDKIQILIDVANSEKEFDEKMWYEIDFAELKKQVKFIAESCSQFVSLDIDGKSFYLPRYYSTDFVQTLYFRIVNNKITFSANKIVEILQGADARRFRLCPICDRIFWAKKLNAGTCGNKKCADELGNRKRSSAAKTEKEKLDNHFQSRKK